MALSLDERKDVLFLCEIPHYDLYYLDLKKHIYKQNSRSSYLLNHSAFLKQCQPHVQIIAQLTLTEESYRKYSCWSVILCIWMWF